MHAYDTQQQQLSIIDGRFTIYTSYFEALVSMKYTPDLKIPLRKGVVQAQVCSMVGFVPRSYSANLGSDQGESLSPYIRSILEGVL